jgi:hypothetical protein
MTITAPSSVTRARAGAPGRARWALPHTLAVVGVLALFWGAWTMIAWLLDGPYSITQYQDPDSASFTAARVIETALVLTGIGLGGWLVRQCLRERRLVFDAKLSLASLTLLWMDPLSNFAQPIFMQSSNWTNLNAWCGHMPLVVNPECGRMPEPILFLSFAYPFGWLAMLLLMNAGMRAARNRWPDLSTGRLVAGTFAAGVVVDIILEAPMVGLRLWNYTGAGPGWMSIFGAHHRFPIVEVIAGALIFATLALIRFNKDDQGRTIVERGLEHMPSRRRTLVSLLALTGVTNTLLAIATVAVVVTGPYADPYPKLPAHLVNGLCDAPGFEGKTRYGPCPGSPGYHAPIRTLPGERP